MSAKSRFKSERRRDRRLTLGFERIADTYWTTAGELREMVAELDRLEVADNASIQLKRRTDDDELGPVGWSLNLIVPEAAAPLPEGTQP